MRPVFTLLLALTFVLVPARAQPAGDSPIGEMSRQAEQIREGVVQVKVQRVVGL